jgi:sulfite exporter TauE/SafE
MFGIALLSSNAARGAEFGLAFGLGTVPLLWLAQHQFHRLRLKLSPLTMSRLQRGLAFVTALIMAWRLHDTIPLMNQTASEKKELPSCCHEE